MSVDGLSTVEGVADFLDAEVVAKVPAELRGEVRAAAKLLRACALELSVRPREVGTEIEELLTLCEQAELDPFDRRAVTELRSRNSGPTLTLRQQEALRLELHELVSRIMTRYVEAGDAGLAAFVHCLGAHAARRSTWQSVFAVSPEGVQQ